MEILKGKDLVVLVSGKPVFHATQHQITLNAEFEDVETKSMSSKEKILTGHSGTVQVDGLVGIDGLVNTAIGDNKATNEIAVDALIKTLKVGTPVELLSEVPDGLGSTTPLEIEKAWITSISMSGQVDQKSSYSAQFSFNDFEIE